MRGGKEQTIDRVAVRIMPCIKFMDDASIIAFCDEQIASDNLTSPYVVKKYEVIRTKKSVVTVMEYCNGRSLNELMQFRGSLSEKETWHIIKQIALGLKHMSEWDYVHRDLKPDNIVLNFSMKGLNGMRLSQEQLHECYQDVSNCEVKICDLGFVRAIKPGTLCESFDAGNRALSAPEKLFRLGYDNQNEVWALGQLFFYCIQGTYMFNTLGKLPQNENELAMFLY